MKQRTFPSLFFILQTNSVAMIINATRAAAMTTIMAANSVVARLPIIPLLEPTITGINVNNILWTVLCGSKAQ